MKRLLCAILAAACLLLTGCSRKNPYEGAENPIATITMKDGSTMRFELHLEIAPNTVANFTKLANDGFYDGLEFFRIVPGVLIQAGCPDNDGTGNAGYTIKGEFSANGVKNDLSHTRGVISMARKGTGNNTAGSQFFIVQTDSPHLDGQYAAFGRVIDEESMKVVDEIAATSTDANDKPLSEWRIKSITVDTQGYTYKPTRIEQ